jgi:hypothetical protein
MVKEA